MKKVALISVWNHNYGSLLQTYALQKFLSLNHYTNEIILYNESNLLRRLIRFFNFSYLIAKYKIIQRNLTFSVFYPEIYKNLQVRSIKFESFKTIRLDFSSPLNNRKELRRYIQNFDVVVLGSDQVLHPANLLMDYFTLGFVPMNIKKIAFAPSFGVSNIPFYQKRRTKCYLNKFDYLSSREISGKKIVKTLTQREIPVVCDPTLLMDKLIWDDLKGEERFISEKYIFCYLLGNNPLHRSFANSIKAATGYKIVALQHLDEFVKEDILFGDIKPFDVGPAEFVNLISNAEYILTDSFHATIFSIIYQKQFFTFDRYQSKIRSTSSRISSILELLDLLDRKLQGSEPIDSYLEKVICYNAVMTKVATIKKSSAEFLLDALKR